MRCVTGESKSPRDRHRVNAFAHREEYQRFSQESRAMARDEPVKAPSVVRRLGENARHVAHFAAGANLELAVQVEAEVGLG
jgi:hypothetical protein